MKKQNHIVGLGKALKALKYSPELKAQFEDMRGDMPAGKEPAPEPLPENGVVLTRPLPSYVRMTRQPLYDTEWCLRDKPNPVPMFARPMGMNFFCMDDHKTEADTNMTMGGVLPIPMMFDWHCWRTEFSPDVPLDLVANFRFCSRLQFQFGARIWYSVPLSYIPCSMLAGIEELKQAVSVLCTNDRAKFKVAWEHAEVVAVEDIPKEETIAGLLRHKIYKTEQARNLAKDNGRPYRIRHSEFFIANVATNWNCGLKLPEKIAVRLYLEGFLYLPI